MPIMSLSMSDIVSVVLPSAAVGSVVTGGFTVWNTRRLIEHQREQDRLRDERALRDAKYARMRQIYLGAIEAIEMMTMIAKRAAGLLGPLTDFDAEQHKAKQMRISAAITEMRIEPEAAPIAAKLVELNQMASRLLSTEDPPSMPEAKAISLAVNVGIVEAAEMIQAHLAKLQEPL